MTKRKTFKKLFVVMLVLVFAMGSVLTGCGSSDTGKVSDSNKDNETVPQNIGANYQWGDKAFEDAVRKAATGKTIKIGFTPPAASEFYDIIQHGAYTMMNELSDRFDVKFEFDFAAPSEHQAVESQVATIENWVTKKFSAIGTSSAGDFDAMNAVFKRAMDAGSSVYMFNMPAEMWDEKEFNVVSAIGYNNTYQSGYLVGKYAAEKLNGKGKILMVWGIPGHWATARKNGFLEAIKPYPDLQIVAEQRGDYVRDKGMQAAENLLEAHPDANFIYGENEEMGLGAAQAVEARGLKLWDGKEGIIVVGADGLKSGFESIREGKLTATVNVGPVDMGREFVMSVFMHDVLGYSVDKVLNVPTTVVDKDNVDVAESYVDWALKTDLKK